MSRPVRYTCILALAALATVLAAVGGWRFARASAPVSGPILLISVDALRADRLPVYGYAGVETPAIDSLAADGVVFERAYSHAPQTLPAHASLLSGRLPFETGVRDNVGFTVRADERMVAEMLSDRGYQTAGIVSSYALREATGISQGFDYFNSDLPRLRFGGTVGPLLRDGADSQRLAEAWLESQGGERSFVFLHISEPHTPYRPPDHFAHGDPYDGEIAYADEIIGQMIRYLKTHQLYDQATIILVSDHGEGLNDHGERAHGLFVYDENVRVPLIIKAAGGLGAGRRVRDIVQHVDLVPTILDLARAPLPDNLAGRSLTPIIEDGQTFPARFVYSESLYGRYHFGWGDLTSLTDGRLRYIAAPREELYDLDVDPDQRNNIVDERPEDAADLREALSRLEATLVVPMPEEIASADRDRLEALGYVGRVDVIDDGADDADVVDPKDGRAVLEAYRQAMDRVVEREWPQAMSGFQTILRRQPNLVDAWRQLGRTASLAGRPERSVEAYRRVLALNPHDVETRLRLGGVLLRLRRLGDARQEAERALETLDSAPHGPSHASAHELLARIAIARGDESSARQHAAAVEELDEKRPLKAYVDGRLLYEQGRYADALPYFEEALEHRVAASAIADLSFHAADVLVRLERFEEAEQRFLEELDAYPQHARSWAGLATLYHATGRIAEAEETLTEFVRIAPTPDSFATATRLLMAFGRPEQAASMRAAADRRFPAESTAAVTLQ